MLFFNNSELNLDLTPHQYVSGSIRRDLFKDPSKIISGSLESDDSSSLESDQYIRDLTIDEQIDVGFFDQLKTPSDEVKPFPTLEESLSAPSPFNTNYSNHGDFGNIFRVPNSRRIKLSASPVASTSTSLFDEEMDDRSEHRSSASSSRRLLIPSISSHDMANTDSLTTPVISENSSIALGGPLFPPHPTDLTGFQPLNTFDFTQQNDSDQTTASTSSPSQHVSTTSSSSPSYPSSEHHHDNLTKMTFVNSSIYLGQQQQQSMASSNSPQNRSLSSSIFTPSTSPSTSAYTNTGSVYPNTSASTSHQHRSSSGSGTNTSYTSFTAGQYNRQLDSSSYSPTTGLASNYTELTPSRPPPPLYQGTMVPTVVDDHYSRGSTESPAPMASSSPSMPHQSTPRIRGRPSVSSIPSPSPSNCSSQQSSTQDHYRDSPNQLVHNMLRNDQPSGSCSRNQTGMEGSSTRRSRPTKKEKLTNLQQEEKDLRARNAQFKNNVETLERDVRVLKSLLISVVRGERCGYHRRES